MKANEKFDLNEESSIRLIPRITADVFFRKIYPPIIGPFGHPLGIAKIYTPLDLYLEPIQMNFEFMGSNSPELWMTIN